MKIKLFALTMLLAISSLVGASVLTPSHAEAAKSTGTAPLKIPITSSQSGGVLSGVFQVYQFVASNGQLVAVGKYSGTVTNTTTGATQTVKNMAASAPVLDPPSASCSILDLTLGPLHLDLLGLVVDLNQVHLTITAQQGSGNLLGNLLCAVAGLLDNNGGTLSGILNQIVGLLNQIIAQL